MQALMRIIYILIVAFLASINLNAQVELGSEFPVSDFGEKTLYKYQNNLFVFGEKENLNFSLLKEPLLLKIPVVNQSDEEDFILVIDNPFFDTISVSQFSNPNVAYQTGDMFDNVTRPLDYRAFAFPIKIPKGVSDTIYVAIRSKTSSFLPVSIHSEKSYSEMQMYHSLLFGVLGGILLIMFLYNLFIFFVLRKTTYVWYSALVVCNIFIFLCIEGQAKQFLWTGEGLWANRMITFFIALGNPLLAQFALSFLGRRNVSARIKKIATGITVLGLLLAMLAFIAPPILVFKPTQILSLFNSIFMLVIGFIYWRKGNDSALYFVVAFGVYLTGAIIVLARNLGFASVNFLTNHLIEVGSTIEVWLLSIALADRFKRIEQDKRIAQRSLLDLQQKENIELEKKVLERTKKLHSANDEIVTQNEELKQMSEEVSSQRDVLEARNKIIERKNTDIISSINAAQRIQKALLPNSKTMSEVLGKYSVLYMPKNVVSGDFYYVARNSSKTYVAVADCTGHGVPGAIMSVIGHNALEKAIESKYLNSPAEILEEVHRSVVQSLNQSGGENMEGMDMAIVCFDKANRQLSMAGAKNPVFVKINENEVQTIKTDNFPIGGVRRKPNTEYSNKPIQVNEGDKVKLFLCSDGLQDQFGGEENKKLGRKKLVKKLEEYGSVEGISTKMERFIIEWRETADEEQIDDICLLAFEINF
ncbi:MAG: serine phosphatase RsbU (regulator of sigma subunit) [Flammeovirgaceae bacterium]